MRKTATGLLIIGLVFGTQAQAFRHLGGWGPHYGPGPVVVRPHHNTVVVPPRRGPVVVAPHPYYNHWVAPAVGGALVGAAIANSANSGPDTVVVQEVPTPSSDYMNAKRRCASLYSSYDWGSATYVDHNGRVLSCP